MLSSAALPILLAPVLAAVLFAAAVHDVRTRTIPDALTGGGAVAVLLVRLAAGPATVPSSLLWAGLLAAGLGALALAAPDGMGLGDAKLAGVLGLALGPGALVALLVGCGATTAVGVAVALRDGIAAARRLTVPLAPYLGLGAVAAWGLGWA
jgi:leader peptidase (prepilin peptidase)/N-methyltransferase